MRRCWGVGRFSFACDTRQHSSPARLAPKTYRRPFRGDEVEQFVLHVALDDDRAIGDRRAAGEPTAEELAGCLQVNAYKRRDVRKSQPVETVDPSSHVRTILT